MFNYKYKATPIFSLMQFWGRLLIMAKIMYSYSSFLATKHPYLLRVLAPIHYF